MSDKLLPSWDRIANNDPSFDSLLLSLLRRTADETCATCNQPFVTRTEYCEHSHARRVLSLVRIVTHPPDCPDCAAIHAADKKKERTK